jgi:hypothetical protein
MLKNRWEQNKVNKKARKERIYKGSIPDKKDGWERVAACSDRDGTEWVLCRKEQSHDSTWATYKLCVNGQAPRKANYWFARNEETGQIGFSRDLAILREYRPYLHAMVGTHFNWNQYWAENC